MGLKTGIWASRLGLEGGYVGGGGEGDSRPEGALGGDKRTNERKVKQKSSCVLLDFVPLGAAAQNRLQMNLTGSWWGPLLIVRLGPHGPWAPQLSRECPLISSTLDQRRGKQQSQISSLLSTQSQQHLQQALSTTTKATQSSIVWVARELHDLEEALLRDVSVVANRSLKLHMDSGSCCPIDVIYQ